jgi:hypothetical protein
MRKVVSVSLGTSKRNKRDEVVILGESFLLERVGTDGDMRRFGQVDALGVGGADIWVVVDGKKYAFQEILKLVRGATNTPVVDGSGLKHTLERETIRSLQRDGIVDFKGLKVLLVSAVDRFGMAQALVEAGADVEFGDLMFGVGLNIPLRTTKQLRQFGSTLLPIVTRLPFKWFYPTGEKQEQRTPKFAKSFERADLICGDWHYIRRYAPNSLKGKTIITQTLRSADLELLRQWEVVRAITTTPVIGGETFATNVMEGVIVAQIQKRPSEIHDKEYLDILGRLGWQPNVIGLTNP